MLVCVIESGCRWVSLCYAEQPRQLLSAFNAEK